MIRMDTVVHDPLAEFKERLLPPLKSRALADAAGALVDGQMGLAETLVGDYLRKKPADPDALNIMAEIARRAKRFDEAEALLEQCVSQAREKVGFRYNYSVVLRHRHKYEHALAQIDELLQEYPGNPLFRDQKATILTRAGKHAEAVACRRELIEQFPLWAKGWLYYGSALRDVGEQEKCVSAFHRALELDPALSGVYASLASLKVYRFTPADIDRMEELLRQSQLPSDSRVDLHHALGKAYADVKNYARSFESYAKANALRRMGTAFDPDRLIAQRRACEELFTENFFRQRAGWGSPSLGPIFIVGLPRSGSTLIEQILSSHSAVEGLGELPDLDAALVGPLAKAGEEVRLQEISNGMAVEKSALVLAYLRLLDRFTSEDFRAIGEQYLKTTAARRTSGRPFFTDKALRNFFYVGLIQLSLPNAKIIDARRHPLDCGWSCFRSQFQGSHFTLKLSDIGKDYLNYVRLMAHFDRVLPGRVHRVIHENLVTDFESELRRLFDYLGLPFDERCLRFYENERPVFTQSSEQVRKPLNKSGMKQWLPYEPWLTPLKAALGPVLDCYPHVPE